MGLISVCEPSPFRLLLHEIALHTLNLRWRDTKIKTVGKGVSWVQFLNPRSAPVSREHFLPKRYSPYSLCWPCHPVWEHLSLFQTQYVLLCSASACVSYGSWPTPLLYCPVREGDGVLLVHSSGAGHESQLPCIGCQGATTGHGRPRPSTEAHLALSPSCE